ncbi:hypothetical protein [Puniceibacterium sp. IMCC21224]|uniref:hypothetical protein n=1 Tax=Puniceibacterium sp. IMCC21224 TaxID=1618204 RepID=UPI00064DA145|nr:hypothetical protein [Puniceibacterium sp. IMCC21224]
MATFNFAQPINFNTLEILTDTILKTTSTRVLISDGVLVARYDCDFSEIGDHPRLPGIGGGRLLIQAGIP